MTMNMSKKTIRTSKRLSWLLRHGAPEAGIAMDPAGWMEVDAVLRCLSISRAALDEAIETNTKSRLQLEGGRVRCCQGHSSASGVSADALEASWARYEGRDLVWHGTSAGVLGAIAREGVLPQRRTHVHLAPGLASVVGKRAQVDVMLGADPERLRAAGEELFVAQNGVILARRIPASCIVELRAMTQRTRAREAELRAILFAERRSA